MPATDAQPKKVRVLAVADEVDPALYTQTLKELEADLIVSCGDLPFDYLEYLVTVANVPLLYVPGNHDPGLEPKPPIDPFRPGYIDASHREIPGPAGCINVDGRIFDAAGLRVAGLGGSMRYSRGPHQYTDAHMRRRALRLEARARFKAMRDRRRVRLVVTHVPPLGSGDGDDDPHRGARALWRLLEKLEPEVMAHGHIHPYGGSAPDRTIGATQVVNAVGHRVLEISM